MASGRLLPCPSCARHVRSTESACPFCAVELAPVASGEPVARTPSKRLSRAALYALGAGAAAIAACGGSTTTGSQFGSDGGPDAEQMGQPLYGGPPVDASVDGPFLVDAAYGGPPPDAADAAGDAADDADSGFAPLYGAPPP